MKPIMKAITKNNYPKISYAEPAAQGTEGVTDQITGACFSVAAGTVISLFLVIKLIASLFGHF